jgi:uncharacterized membrane protein (DUF106 family)
MKQEFSKNQELQESLKKFREDAKKLEESKELKEARRKFESIEGFLSFKYFFYYTSSLFIVASILIINFFKWCKVFRHGWDWNLCKAERKNFSFPFRSIVVWFPPFKVKIAEIQIPFHSVLAEKLQKQND